MTQQPVTLPPGRYLIGDPAFAVTTDHWPQFLNSPDSMSAVFQTPGGDGTRIDNSGRIYDIESDLIAAVPVGIARNPRGPAFRHHVGTIKTFRHPLVCQQLPGNIVAFGDVTIQA